MAAKNTLFLSVFAFLLYVPVTLILATLAALSKGKLPDSLISVATLIGLSLPEFVLGTLLIYVFAVQLSVRREFADPDPITFAQLMNQSTWDAYCEAFA